MVDSVIGVGDLTKKFKQLNSDVQNKTGRRMVASGAGVIRNESKRIVMTKGLIRTKALYNNIVVKRETKPAPNTIQYNVGVRHGRNLTRKQKQNSTVVLRRKNGRIVKMRKNDPFYWRFIEFKHKTRSPSAREVPADPFLAPALDNKHQAAIDKMGSVLDNELQKVG